MNIPAEQQFKANPLLYSDLGPQLIRYIRELESKLSTHNLRPVEFETYITITVPADPDALEIYKRQNWQKQELKQLTGRFHQFALEGDGQDIGPVAIIETPDGQIYTPAATKCRFLDHSPSESSVKTSDKT